jgi:hypothetical protein
MNWNENRSAVTRAFDEWKLVDRDVRAFVRLVDRLLEREFDHLWDEATRSAHPEADGWDVYSALEVSLERMSPSDYTWMLRAAVVRDAVTAFEVYLEKAAKEVMGPHGIAFKAKPGRGVEWRDLKAFYQRYMDLDIATDEVRRIRDLRHVLVHLRGELRTEQQREEYGQTDSGFRSFQAVLTQEAVLAMCDTLAETVRRIDPVMWRFSWGGESAPKLLLFLSQDLEGEGTAEESPAVLGPIDDPW